MKFFSSFILIVISLLPLSASEDYGRLIITKTSDKNNLNSIQKKLDATHTRMFVQQSGIYYKIYSQNFKDKESATQALDKVKHFFPYARLILFTNNITKDTNDYFVALALGIDKLTGSGTAQTQGVSYAFEIGYNYTKHINSTLSYLSSSTKDTDIHNIYSALNYNFYINKDFYIYLGGLVGYSTLKLKNSISESKAILFGIQTGAMYNLNNNIGFYTVYQGISLGHKIDIVDTTDTLNVNFLHHLQIGLQYRF